MIFDQRDRLLTLKPNYKAGCAAAGRSRCAYLENGRRAKGVGA
jgi:hypothetical protein